jgi:hypothetical protein
VKQH